MKKIVSILLVVLMVICTLNINQVPATASHSVGDSGYEESIGLVYTPNGTDVSDLSLTGGLYWKVHHRLYRYREGAGEGKIRGRLPKCSIHF